MGKGADQYFLCEPWRVVERGFDPARALVSESIFSLANEHMGVRGYFEEGTSAPSLLGSYFGGVYELDGENTPGGYKGIVKQSHYMVCGPDYLACTLRIGGETLDVATGDLTDFERALDLRTGVLSREFVWRTPVGRVRVRFERLLSMADARQAAQRLTLTALDAAGTAALSLGLHGDTVHRTTGRCDWQARGNFSSQNQAALLVETGTTGQAVLCAMAVRGGGQPKVSETPLRLDLAYTLKLPLGQPVSVLRGVVNEVYRDGVPSPSRLPSAAEAAAALPGWDELVAQNRAHYDAFWRTADVEIAGDEPNQQGIRYCIFQLHQTYRGLDPRSNIGAKGLTGEAYNGHAFWDTETYCLPYYLLSQPESAKNLLLYRYHTLPQAKRRAAQLDCQGACYPIATLNGNEACTLWQHASLQMQPSTAVAYGIWHYAHLTGDTTFLYQEGLEMLLEICRYLASRGDWNQQRTAYGYYGVMGPDEFHMMVNHNYYTNLMGKKALEYTLQVLADMQAAAPEQRSALLARLGITSQELARWADMAAGMRLAQDERGVYEQHEGYFTLPHLDIRAIPQSQFPLYAHWSYDRIYRTDMIKQPDVLMAMFLYPQDYSPAVKRANYDYYEPRCIHESSLSPSVHAILASELGLHQAAAAFFGFATRMDLDNFNRNTGEGLHLTSIAAAWVTILYGFGGLRTDGDLPSLAPSLPAGWQGYKFRLLLHGSTLSVAIDPQQVTLTVLAGAPVTLRLYGEEITVGAMPHTAPLPADSRGAATVSA